MYSGLIKAIDEELEALKAEGRLKGEEKVIVGIKPPDGEHGPRIVLDNGKELINFASNSYLGLSGDPRLIQAEHENSLKYGVGPGAVRFISGTQEPHVKLEQRLAGFFRKEAAMIFSSAYAANCGIISPLITHDTFVISDELNHNSIINAIRLSGIPRERKKIFPHCDMDGLEECIKEAFGKAKRVLIVSDGVFSMRGDYAPLDKILELSKKYNDSFEEGIITIVDDSHGIGAFGETGRGVVEVCNAWDVDVITGTLGKALGVDGGFVVADKRLVDYFREKSPFYVYSNPISAGIAGASIVALDILDSPEGIELLKRLGENTEYFRKRLGEIGLKTIDGIHPIVPVIIGDPIKAKMLAEKLFERGIYVVALTFPVVPRGQDTIRVQISASHTKKDLDFAIESFRNASRELK